MLLTTGAGRPLYEKLGFRLIGSSLRHQGTYRREPVPDPRMRPATSADLPALVTLAGRQCHQVVGFERLTSKHHLVTCRNGRRYRVHVTPAGRVAVADH